METSIQRIVNGLEDIRDRITLLLSTYSKIKRVIFPSDMIFSLLGDYAFVALPADAYPIQDRIIKDFNTRLDTVEILVVDSAVSHKKEIKASRERLILYVQQDHRIHESNLEQVVLSVRTHFDKILGVLNLLFPSGDPAPIIIPDSNALYINPDIEEWCFEGFDKFTIILTPSVLKDLDRHKIEHRNEEVKSKAKKLINKIKDYRGRGSLIEGVPIITGRIDLMSIAVEPDFTKALKWLDSGNDDDRLIAEAFEILRANCHRPCCIVTADINLQNKCEMAELPYIEPPVTKKIQER